MTDIAEQVAARRIMEPLQGSLDLLPDEPRYQVRAHGRSRVTGWRVPDEARNPRAGNSLRLIERNGPNWLGLETFINAIT